VRATNFRCDVVPMIDRAANTPLDDYVGTDCQCEFTPDDDGTTEDACHFLRRCRHCGKTWFSLHCPHDGYQGSCPHCGERGGRIA
jgi:hypothetical protein